ncbi:MAG: phage protease [Verrucomicrobiota bacterium]
MSEFKHPSDGWYMIEPKGEHRNAAAGLVQVIDDEAGAAIVNRFNSDATAGTLRHGHEMLVDHEHFSDQLDQESRAYGWLTQLQNRADGIYGQVRWTATGKAAVDGGDYRFFSTEYLPKDLKILNDGKVKRGRPLRLDGLTLTNMNNNRGQRPITNRASSEGSAGKASPAVLKDVAAEQARHDRIKEPIVKWFQAVKQVKDSALTHLGYGGAGNITFSHAWNLAKVHYPAEYAAAHGLLSETPAADDPSDVQLAGQQLTDVTNRISQIAGCDLRSAYDIAQGEFPKLVNRLTPNSTRILNRKSHPVKPEAVQKAAGKIINRMIAEAMAGSGHPHSVCFSRVMGMEPILGQFAAGQISPGEILVSHPDLWERLSNEA